MNAKRNSTETVYHVMLTLSCGPTVMRVYKVLAAAERYVAAQGDRYTIKQVERPVTGKV